MRTALALGVLACALGSASPAAAEYRRRVVLLERAGDAASTEVQARVRGELAGAGFEVVALPLAPSADAERSAEEVAGELHPAAVLYVVEAPAGASARTLVIDDRLLHKRYEVRFRGDAQPPPSQAAQVAVQAVEILNADLAELSLTHAAPAPVVTRAPVREAPPPRTDGERRRVHAELAAGAGVLEGFHGTGATWTPIFRAGVSAPESWSDDVPVAFSLLANVAAFGGAVTIVTPNGSAALEQALGELEVVGRLLPHAAFQPVLLVKSGAYTLRAEGTNGPVVRGARTWTATCGGGAGVRAVVSASLAVVLSGELSFAWSRSIVRIAKREVAAAGSPAALYGVTVAGVF